MNLTIRKTGGLPSLLRDLFSPASLLGRDIFDFDPELAPSRLGINLPSVNIAETPNSFTLELAAPGLQRSDFNIEVENRMLTVSAEKEAEKKDEAEAYSCKEYSFNSFSRSFTLPENVREGDIEARYENGILKVVIPKLKETPVKPVKKINIE